MPLTADNVRDHGCTAKLNTTAMSLVVWHYLPELPEKLPCEVIATRMESSKNTDHAWCYKDDRGNVVLEFDTFITNEVYAWSYMPAPAPAKETKCKPT